MCLLTNTEQLSAGEAVEQKAVTYRHIAGCSICDLPRHCAGTICEGVIFDLLMSWWWVEKMNQIVPTPHILPLNTYFNTYFNQVNQPGEQGQL